ncbi:MAG TPA: CRISPR-associated protein Cas4 [Anaerolineales bacterium]|jgi:CRISPR-associated exonuclease Cas4|nr:CRISPR-associated protein Cas4 [Anaerolineales bacterium]HQX15605.1 CRISPR-associated protein Cas4 [Anaerolineales bacterium]
MLYVAFFLLLLAFLFFWQSNRQRSEAGLPGGRVIYTDTRGWNKLEKPLFYAALELTGKPDYLVEQNGKIIPVEVKSGRAPEAPYDSHIYQLASYCLLVEKTYHKRPPYGIIHYDDKNFSVEYTHELEQSLLELLTEMKRDGMKKEVARSHEQASRCKRCGFKSVCDQSLA